MHSIEFKVLLNFSSVCWPLVATCQNLETVWFYSKGLCLNCDAIASQQLPASTGLNPAIDSDIAGLNYQFSLTASLNNSNNLEKLVKLNHRTAGCHREVPSFYSNPS